jgi:hypothetical protein
MVKTVPMISLRDDQPYDRKRYAKGETFLAHPNDAKILKLTKRADYHTRAIRAAPPAAAVVAATRPRAARAGPNAPENALETPRPGDPRQYPTRRLTAED